MAQDAGYIRNKGNNRAFFVLLNSATYAQPTLSTSNCVDLGHLAEATHKIESSITEYRSNDGIVRASDEEYTGSQMFKLMQTSKALLDFFGYTVRNGIGLLYSNEGLKNGLTQELFSIVRPHCGFNMVTPGAANSNEITFTPIKLDATLTVTSGEIDLIESFLSITVVATSSISIVNEINIYES